MHDETSILHTEQFVSDPLTLSQNMFYFMSYSTIMLCPWKIACIYLYMYVLYALKLKHNVDETQIAHGVHFMIGAPT